MLLLFIGLFGDGLISLLLWPVTKRNAENHYNCSIRACLKSIIYGKIRKNQRKERNNMRKPYPSDITREQFAMIREELEKAKRTTSPRKVDLYDVFCAILYLLKNGCTWRALPHDFPDYRLVNYYYGIWTKKNVDGQSLLDYILAKLVDLERYETRENPTPSMLIIDSKSVKNADTAKEKGYDAGKKLQASKSI